VVELSSAAKNKDQNAMTSKCDCQQCSFPIEFEASEFVKTGETSYRILGQEVTCPHCQQPTSIYLRRPEFQVSPSAASRKPNTSIWTIIIGGVVSFSLLIFLLVQIHQNPGSASDVGEYAIDFAVGIIGLLIYFTPSISAALRGKKNAFAIFMLNFLLGWTFIGWVIAMVWACTKD
jgi:Superinfection immunity protein